MSVQVLPEGSVTSPAGWRAGVAACGLRDGAGADLALVVSEGECHAAGVFTRNLVAAAPVQVDRRQLRERADGYRAVVINAGVANACTGEAGVEAARRTQEAAGRALGFGADQVLVMSTGVIGAPLEVDKIEGGIHQAAEDLSEEAGARAASAIMTTDTRPKHRAVRVEGEWGSYALGGIAKGAGMIHPDMGTMLALITTDLSAPASELQSMLQSAVDRSFHRISVDGDTSTNDTVLLLANGAAGLRLDGTARAPFQRALDGLCQELALEILRDGEGASRFLRLEITGARTEEQALLAARAIATSPLVKTALAGGDPNWGRIVAAVGRSGADLDPAALALWVGVGRSSDIQVLRAGAGILDSKEAAARAFGGRELTARLDLGVGSAAAEFWTTDLTHEYVTINAEYHT